MIIRFASLAFFAYFYMFCFFISYGMESINQESCPPVNSSPALDQDFAAEEAARTVLISIARNDVKHAQVAEEAVRIAIGKDNPYLSRLLQKRLQEKKVSAKRIPVMRLTENSERELLRRHLAEEAKHAQDDSLRALRKEHLQEDDPETSRTVNRWVLNTVLDEKLKDREGKESSDHWKYINGSLAAILPIITGLLQYFLTNRTCNPCSST